MKKHYESTLTNCLELLPVDSLLVASNITEDVTVDEVTAVTAEYDGEETDYFDITLF